MFGGRRAVDLKQDASSESATGATRLSAAIGAAIGTIFSMETPMPSKFIVVLLSLSLLAGCFITIHRPPHSGRVSPYSVMRRKILEICPPDTPEMSAVTALERNGFEQQLSSDTDENSATDKTELRFLKREDGNLDEPWDVVIRLEDGKTTSDISVKQKFKSKKIEEDPDVDRLSTSDSDDILF